jgi:hypothetical protein
MPKQLLTVDEVAQILRVAPSTLAEWRRTGDPDLPFIKINGRIRYRSEDIDSFLVDSDDDTEDDAAGDDEDQDEDEDEDEANDEDDEE